MKNVVAFPGGRAATGPTSLRFRDAFLGTVAAGALSLAIGGPALALPPPGCTLDATFTIETCTGDQSTGVLSPGGIVTTLNVNNLTTAIAPGNGIVGINFTSAGAITITSDTGAFGIATSNAFGILASSTSGAVTVTSTGNITPCTGCFAAGAPVPSEAGHLCSVGFAGGFFIRRLHPLVEP